MKRSYLVLGSLCAALAIADTTLLSASSVIDSAPIETITSTYDGFDYSWVDIEPYIAHAGGGIFGQDYTNSYEALVLNYQLGHRLFEFDFSLTSDDDVVLTHDFATTTADAFNSTLVEDKFRPLSIKQLVNFLYHHPDAYIITDTKYTTQDTARLPLEAIYTAAEALDLAILDRFIIQIYHPEMLPWVMDIYPWRSVIYTLYANPDWTPENVVEFTKSSGVKYITIDQHIITPEILDLWQPAGLLVGVHTINDFGTAKEAFARGIQNIYTDYLTP